MGLVQQWLNGVGLSYAVPTFQAAGIDNPAALAQLDVSYFEALGVTDPEDRRKLFFLVQRIKMAVERRDESATEVDAVLARTMGPSMLLDQEEATRPDPAMLSPSRKKSSPFKENVQKDAEPVRKQTRSPGTLPMRRHNESVLVTSPFRSEKPVHPSDDITAEESSNEKSEEEACDDGNWIGERDQESLEEEEEDPPVRHTEFVPSRRRSARIMEKQKSSDSLSSLGASSASSNGRQSRLAKPTKALGTRRKSDTHLLRGEQPRPSGVPAPGRRSLVATAVPSRSMRTGKQLSTIPSNAEAPMSPLLDVPASSRLTEPLEKHQEEDTTARRRPQSSRGRQSLGGALKEICGPRSRSSSASSRQSLSRVSAQRKSTTATTTAPSASMPSSITTRNRRRSSSITDRSRTVTVQGRRADTSFKAQISQLRQENDGDYELFDRPNDLNDQESMEDMRIRVVVRKRPMSRSEIAAAGDVDVIHPLDYGVYGRVLVYNPKTRVDLTKSIETLPFAFDNVFDESCTNVQIYERSVRHLIPSLFDGQFASIFAYGQTGSGKTFTMMGSNATGMNDPTSVHRTNNDDELNASNLGLYYMAALDLFQAIATPGFDDFHIAVSLFEIYSGKLFDLLNDKRQIKCLEDSKGKVCFPGLTEHEVTNADELMELIEEGGRNRSTGTTSRNADSSRSHAVLQLHLKTPGRRGADIEHSRLTFVDLAGSERGADTATASRATRLEGSEINTSLLALKEVIRALATGDSMAHVPFRGSKLTQVLKESFVGKEGRSVMIACVSPNIGNVETTLNTLRYADRVKERDAQTGELSMAVASAPKPVVLGGVSVSKSSEMEVRGPVKHVSSFNSLESDTSDVLDELLASPRKAPPLPREPDLDEEGSEETSPRKVAMGLIGDHKIAMTTMLGMVKDEMMIVNEADADREGLEDYMTKLNAIHEEQLSMIASLREHLLSYRIIQATGDEEYESDDSFEDLRD